MKRALVTFLLLCAAFAEAFAQSTGVPYFPQTLPGQTVVGRRASTAGATEAIPFSLLSRSLGVTNAQLFPGVDPSGVTDSTVGLQAAINAMPPTGGRLYIPTGTYKVTSALVVPSNHNRGIIYGDGDSTNLVSTSGTNSIFSFTGQGYYGFTLERMRLTGNNIASVAAIDTTPTGAYVFTGHFRYVELAAWTIGWNIPNAQLSVWENCNFDYTGSTSAIVFNVAPVSGSGLQSNANRVRSLRVTGPNVQTIVLTLLSNTERATNWLFENSDFQQTGTATPLTVGDAYWRVINNEFENSTANNLILVQPASAAGVPYYTVIDGNIFSGGGAAGNAKIRLDTANGQLPFAVRIEGNDADGPTTPLVDIVAGSSTVIINNRGTVNDTGGTGTIRIGGDAALAQIISARGTVAAPAFSFAGTPTTGIYKTANNDSVSIAAAGVASLALGTSNTAVPQIMLPITGQIGWSVNASADSLTPDTYISRNAAATVQLGQADAAAPVPQTFKAQSALTGSGSNIGGPDFTLQPGLGTGFGTTSTYGLGRIVFSTPVQKATGATIQTYAAAGYIGPQTITSTVANPVLDLNQTWNNASLTGTGIRLNVTSTASAAASLLADFQLASTSQWNVTKGGATTQLGVLTGPAGAVGAPTYTFAATPTTGIYKTANNDSVSIASAGQATIALGTSNGAVPEIMLRNTAGIGWSVNASADSLTPDTYITRPAAAAVQFGAADAAAPVAQSTRVQSVVAGTSNTAGTDWTLKASVGTGTGTGGSIIFQTAPAGSTGTSQNTLVSALTIDQKTHLRPGGTAPALTSCGTSPAITGTDTAGVVTMGTTATGCVITFNKAYTSAPHCTVSWQDTPLASQSYTVTNTAITTVQTSTSNNLLNYTCFAQTGG